MSPPPGYGWGGGGGGGGWDPLMSPPTDDNSMMQMLWSELNGMLDYWSKALTLLWQPRFPLLVSEIGTFSVRTRHYTDPMASLFYGLETPLVTFYKCSRIIRDLTTWLTL